MAGVGTDRQASAWARWLRQPQTVWARRALFQVHLWLGLVLGLYIVMLSVTGSILVYAREINRLLSSPDEEFTAGQFALLRIARLHDDLMFDSTGQWWNGVGSLLVTVLVVTGVIVWWPGVSRWRRSLGVKTSAGWRRFNWDLHSALGFWLFLFMLMWGVSGFYLGIPEPFTWVAERFGGGDGTSTADNVLAWLARLHFGRWRTPWLKAVWAALGLAPALMFVTGAIMWWNRAVRSR